MSVPTYKGTACPVVSLPPDWTHDPILRVNESTLIFEGLDQSEERWQRYPRPLYGTQYTSKAIDSQQQGYFRKLFETAEAMPMGVPLWMEQVELSDDADSGATTIFTDDSTGTLFAIADYLLIWQDWQTWEVVKCKPVVFGEMVLLDEATANDWKAGAKVMPILFGICKRPDFEALDAADSGLEIEFEERFLFGRFERERTLTPGRPSVTYGGCNETVTLDFGGTIPNLKRFLVEISDDDGETWAQYCMAKRDRTRLVFNNYFGGDKTLRVSFIWLDLTQTTGVYTIKPTAATVAPPTVSVTGFGTPFFALPSNYVGPSGVDGSSVLVVADEEQIDYQGHALLKVPCGEAFIEATKKQYLLHSWSDPQTPSTMDVTVTGPSGSTVKFTIDGTQPTVGSGLDSGATISPYLASFGCVIIARAFKDGCQSAPVYLLVDKAVDMQDRFESKVGAIAASSSCDLWNWQRSPNPTDPDSDCIALPTHRSCWTLYGSNSSSGVLAAWQQTLTATPSGPSVHLQIYQNDSSASVSGVTTDPGTCSSGSTWTDGTVTMVDTSQSVASFQSTAQVDLATDLAAMPNSITCLYTILTTDDPDTPGVAQPYSSRLAADFFGPSRNVLAWTDSGIGLYAGNTAAAALLSLAIVMSLTVNPAYSIHLTNMYLVCTLAPSEAPDIWNADDLAP